MTIIVILNSIITFSFFTLSRAFNVHHSFSRSYARKKGRNNVTVDDLIHVITPKGRGKHSTIANLYHSLNAWQNNVNFGAYHKCYKLCQ